MRGTHRAQDPEQNLIQPAVTKEVVLRTVSTPGEEKGGGGCLMTRPPLFNLLTKYCTHSISPSGQSQPTNHTTTKRPQYLSISFKKKAVLVSNKFRKKEKTRIIHQGFDVRSSPVRNCAYNSLHLYRALVDNEDISRGVPATSEIKENSS